MFVGSPDLCNRVTFAVFHFCGKVPVPKERFNKKPSGLDMMVALLFSNLNARFSTPQVSF